MNVDIQRLIEVLIAAGAGLLGALTVAWKTHHDAQRDDRVQRSNEASTSATAADAITKAAKSIVELQDSQVDELKALIEQQRQEFQKRFDAQGAALSAYETRLDREMQEKLRMFAQISVMQDQIDKQQRDLAAMGAQFELVNQDNVSLRNEREEMKATIYKLAIGVQTLTRQIKSLNVKPMYELDIPLTPTGRLGPIDAEAARNYQG